MLSGSFMDYALPRASDMPSIVSEFDENQPCPHNPLGAKGCGEAGSIGAPAAIVSVVLEALRPLSVTDIQLPMTAEKCDRIHVVLHTEHCNDVAAPARRIDGCKFLFGSSQPRNMRGAFALTWVGI